MFQFDGAPFDVTQMSKAIDDGTAVWLLFLSAACMPKVTDHRNFTGRLRIRGEGP